MNNYDKKSKDRWINDVLESADGMQRATANPFLYTRIMARIQEANSSWEKTARLISRPSFAFATVLLILVINVWVAFQHQQGNRDVAEAPLTEAETLFAAEYSGMGNYSLIDPNEVK